MKLYPEYDIDETTIPVSNNTVEEDQPKGNGSGFFISTNVIATNNHVAVYDSSGNSSFYQVTASTKELKVTFTDGTETLLKDAYRNFF